MATKKIEKKNKTKAVVEKVVRKASISQKALAKQSISAKKSERGSKKKLVTASEGQRFWINNGPVLGDLKDLYEAFKSISKEQFAYHVRGNNNDFALWVEYILLDKKCADNLKKSKTQKKASQIVEDVLKEYK